MLEKHAPFSLWFQARSGTFAVGFHVPAFEKRGCKIGACVLRLLASPAAPTSEAGVGGGSRVFGVNSLGIYSYTGGKLGEDPQSPAFPRQGSWNKSCRNWLCHKSEFPGLGCPQGFRAGEACPLGPRSGAIPRGQEPGLEGTSCLSCYRGC